MIAIISFIVVHSKNVFFFQTIKIRVIGQSIGGGIHTKSIVLESNNIAKI